jgi:hypothetical protein
MGNVAVAGELAGSDELDEIYRLDLSETGPEDDEGDDEGDEGNEGNDEADTGIKPEGMPHE